MKIPPSHFDKGKINPSLDKRAHDPQRRESHIHRELLVSANINIIYVLCHTK